MKEFYLSLVLDADKECELRYDIVKGTLEEIDQYTTKYNSHKEIRYDNIEKITEFLNSKRHITCQFKKNENGVIVALVKENGKMKKIRVLYKNDKDKANDNKVLKKLSTNLRESYDYKKVFSFFKRNDCFNTEFDRKESTRIYYKSASSEVKKELLIKHIIKRYKEFFKNTKYGHYYLRRADSIMDKDLKATKTSVGTIAANSETIRKTTPTTIVKDNEVKVTDLGLKEEIDNETGLGIDSKTGQYNMFDIINNKSDSKEKDNILTRNGIHSTKTLLTFLETATDEEAEEVYKELKDPRKK